MRRSDRMSTEVRARRAVETIEDGLALLVFATEDLPTGQRRLFLGAVANLSDRVQEIAGLLDLKAELTRDSSC